MIPYLFDIYKKNNNVSLMLFTISLIEYVIKTDKLTLTLKLVFFCFVGREGGGGRGG